MIRFLLKLTLAGLIAHAAWQLGSAYVTFFRFREAVAEASRFGAAKPEEALRRQVLDLAAQFDVPVGDNDFSIRREDGHTYIDGSYSQTIELVPGYPHERSFTWHSDTVAPIPPEFAP
jgi:hypothetical protein